MVVEHSGLTMFRMCFSSQDYEVQQDVQGLECAEGKKEKRVARLEGGAPSQMDDSSNEMWWWDGKSSETDLPQSSALMAKYALFLEHLVRNNTRFPGSQFETRAKNCKEAVNSASSSSLFFTSRPLETAVLKPFFRFTFVAFMVRNLVYLTLFLSGWISHNGSSQFRTYRLTNLPPSSFSAHSSIGLLSGGFQAPLIRKSLHQANSSVEFRLQTDSPIDGWHAELPSDTVLSHLRRVSLEGSTDGQLWSKISVPWVATVRSRRRFTPLEQDKSLAEPLRQFLVEFCFTPENAFKEMEHVVSLVGFGLVVVFSLRFEGPNSVTCAAWTFVLVSLSKVMSTLAIQDPYLKVVEALTIPIYFAHGWGMYFLNRGYLLVLAGCGAFTFATAVVMLCYHPDHDWASDVVIGCMQCGLFVAVLARRHWVLRQARREIKPDVDKYERVWRDLSSVSSDAVEQLVSLRQRVQRMAVERKGQEVRQVTSHPESIAVAHAIQHLKKSSFSLQVPDAPVLSAAVCSLDQLYQQALALSSELKRRVVTWARDSGGMLACRESQVRGGVSQYRTAQQLDEAGAWERVKWAGVKKPDRAIQKLIRIYDLDPSRLLDLCRQSIVFESVADLSRCLDCIDRDPTAICLRVKNRLDPAYNAWTSAGYRDVAVNLRIVSATTERLGIEEHVCELQLILKCYADLKHDQGHRRYVAYRNLRGE